jgi:hypothetical protein
MSNLRQLALAVHQFAGDRQQFPKGCDYPFATAPNPRLTQAGISWHTNCLPYLEQGTLWGLAWEANKQDPTGNSAIHVGVLEKTLAVALCPSDSRRTGGYGNGIVWGLTSYLGVAGSGLYRNDGMFHPGLTVRFADVSDGTSNTIMIGERPAGRHGAFGSWYSVSGDCICPMTQILSTETSGWVPPSTGECLAGSGSLRPGQFDTMCDNNHFWSLHSAGAHFAFSDGSARFLKYSQSPIVPALATRAGNELVDF